LNPHLMEPRDDMSSGSRHSLPRGQPVLAAPDACAKTKKNR
jgi:hypothetical protein